MQNDLKYLTTAYKAIEDKFGEDIVILDIRNLSVLTDYFIITTGKNKSQIKTIADEVSQKLYKEGLEQRHIEGYNTANWVLVDFGNIIVHVFDKESRDFYNIERVWGDAQRVVIDEAQEMA